MHLFPHWSLLIGGPLLNLLHPLQRSPFMAPLPSQLSGTRIYKMWPHPSPSFVQPASRTTLCLVPSGLPLSLLLTIPTTLWSSLLVNVSSLPPLPINYNLNYGQLDWAPVKTINYRCYPNKQPAFPQNLPLVLSASSTTRSRLKFNNNQLANMPLNLPYLASGSSWTLGSCDHQRPTSLALTLQQIRWFVPWMVSILICS